MTKQTPAPGPTSPSPATSTSMSTSERPPALQTTSWLERLSDRQLTWAVILFGLLLYIPFAGSYGLWDPWETHYGEVARQMTKRGDFVSLYWAGSPIDGEHFWSKPVLTFWLMSLAMHVAGIGKRGGPPEEMAIGTTTEWALRIPFCLVALLAIYGVYLVASRFVSRRAGVLSAVCLATMPLFSLVARQAMTDMPFVGPMTLALSLGAVALFERDDEELRRRTWKRFSWPDHPLFYVTLALLALTVLPQLVANSLQVTWRLLGRRSGAIVPGIVLMAPYFAGFAAFVYWSARTRFKAPFYLYIAGILCGLAVLAKGLAGLGLPVIVFLAYLLFTWNWKRLGRAQLLFGVLVAFLACALVAIPWHHAMLIRHGKPFWDELYGDNHWRRMVLGRHGDRGTFEYFLRELGYAVLPWIAIAPSALAWVVMRPFGRAKPPQPGVEEEASRILAPVDRRQEIYWFGAIWFVAAYAVVSLSMTKFHHYILPALPGLAIVVGCFLDDVVARRRARVAGAVALVGLPLLGLVTHDLVSAQNSPQHFLWLFSYDYINAPQGRPWPPELEYRTALGVFAALFGLGAVLLSARRILRFAPAILGLFAVAFTYFLLDVFMKQTSDRWSQKPLIAKYYELRRSPEERLISWQMYWRGETFYTKNEIFEGPLANRTVFLGDRNQETLQDYLGRNKGKRVFFIVEKTRWGTLRGLVPEYARGTLRVLDERNNKFYLATADL
jgi:4-amino-4-deoxy-L-arabinose transferase-like glycosyltransferase